MLFYTWLVLRPRLTLNPLYWRTLLAEFTLPRYVAFWKITEAGYGDIDGVVNANVVLYLGDRPETRQAISWLIAIVESGREMVCDKWYRDPFTFYYALSRNYHAGIEAFNTVRQPILARLAGAVREDGQIGENILHTALAPDTLLSYGDRTGSLARAVEFLRLNQSEDGSWPGASYYYGGPKKATSWGSAELTTGICLEALHRFYESD